MADVEAVPFDHNANLVKDDENVENGQFDCEQSDESKDTEDGLHVNGGEQNGVLVNGIHENGVHENGITENGVNGDCHDNTNNEQKNESGNADDDGIVETTTVTEVTNIIIPADETGETVSEISSSKVVSSTKKTKKMTTSKSASTMKPKGKLLNPASKSSSSLVSKTAPGATKTSTTRTVSKSVTPSKTTIKKTTTTTKTNLPKTTDSKPTATKPTSTRPISSRPATAKPAATTAKPAPSRPASSRPATAKPTSASTKPDGARKPLSTRPASSRPTTAKSTAATGAPKTTVPKTAATKPTPPKTTLSKPASTRPTSAKPSPKATESKTLIEKKTASTSSKVIKSKDTKVTEVKKTTSETKLKTVKTSETSALKKTKPSPSSTMSHRPTTAKTTASKTTPDVEKSKTAKPASAGTKPKTTAAKTTRPTTATTRPTTGTRPATGTRPTTAPSTNASKKTTKTKTDSKTKVPGKKVAKKEEPVVIVAEQEPTDMKVEEPVITPADEKTDLVINLVLEESTPESVSPFSPHSDASETNFNTSSTIESIETTVETVEVESLQTHKDDDLITNDANEEHFQPTESTALDTSSEHDKSFEVIDDSISDIQLELNNLELKDAACKDDQEQTVLPSHEDQHVDNNELDKHINVEDDSHEQTEVESNFEMIEHHDVEESTYLNESKENEGVENDTFVPLTAVSQYADLQTLDTSEHRDDNYTDFGKTYDTDFTTKGGETPTETSHEDEHSLHGTTDDSVSEHAPSSDGANKIETSSESYHGDVQQTYEHEQQHSNAYLSREAELFCVTPLDRGLESDDAVTPFENSSPESSPAKSPFTSLDLTQDKSERIYDVETPMSDVAVCGTDEGSDQVLSSMEELSQEEDNKSPFHYDEPHEHRDYQSMNTEKEGDFEMERPEPEGHVDMSHDYKTNDEEKHDQDYPSQEFKEVGQFQTEQDHQNVDMQFDQSEENQHADAAFDGENRAETQQYVEDYQSHTTEDYQSHATEDHRPHTTEDYQPETGDLHQHSEDSQQHSEVNESNLHFGSVEGMKGNEDETSQDQSKFECRDEESQHADHIFDSVGNETKESSGVDDGQQQQQQHEQQHEDKAEQNYDNCATDNDGQNENISTSQTQNHSYDENVRDDMEEIGINRTNEGEDCYREEIEVKTVWEKDGTEVSGANEASQHIMENDQTAHENSEDTTQQQPDESSEPVGESNGIVFMKRMNGSDKESSDESEDPSSPNHHIMEKVSTTTTTTTYNDYEGMQVETESSNNFYDDFASDQHALTNAENLG